MCPVAGAQTTHVSGGRPAAHRQRYRPRQTMTPTDDDDDRKQATDTSVQKNTGPLDRPVMSSMRILNDVDYRHCILALGQIIFKFLDDEAFS